MAQPGEFEAFIPLLAMAFVWRMSYELSRPKPEASERLCFLFEKQSQLTLDQTAFIPRQKEWAAKAVKRYAESQDKKWRNWTEAMFEPD